MPTSVRWPLLLATTLALTPGLCLAGWTRLQSSVYGERYDDLHFLTPDEGWAVNGFGEIWHTEDGGESWDMQYDNGNIYFRSIEFANERLGWAGTVTSSQPLFSTKDGGKNWNPVRHLPAYPRPVAFCGIHVVNAAVMYATGVWSGPAYILRTNDGGSSYTGIEMPDWIAVGLIDIYFKNINEGFAVGGVGEDLFSGKPVILRTSDAGQTWHQHFVGTIPNAWGWKMHFPTPDVGYVSVERINGPHYFLKTTDGGETWEEKPFEGGARSQGIGFVTPEIGWIGGPASVNPTYITTNGGESWTVNSFGVELNRFQFFGTQVGYGAGDYLYKYVETGIEPVGVGDVAPPPPPRTRSFPNPLRAMTTIEYELPEASNVWVFVSDPGGRLLRTLGRGEMASGTHTLEWDGKDDAGRELPPGLYLYVVRSDALDAIGKLVKVE